MKARFKRLYRKLFLLGALLGLAVWGAHVFITHEVQRQMDLRVRWGSLGDEREFEQRMLEHRRKQALAASKDHLAGLAAPVPFEEITLFDEDAWNWSHILQANNTGGLAVFDANGDGLLDVYFPQPGDNWIRPTDEEGFILPKPRRMHNALYLHQGMDASGRPRYAQVKDLAQTNDTYVAEELLVENYLQPRQSLDDSEDREARLARVAVAADLNADGRQDLIVGNGLPGILYSAPETNRIVGAFVSPTGRTEHPMRAGITLPSKWIKKDYVPVHDGGRLRDTGRGREPVGANSLFLNRGDQDGDGIPEWEDVSHAAGITGHRNTSGIVVFDFDLDGDLDLFMSNAGDPDYWPTGATKLSGGANQLYVNQLAETGELRFVERAGDLDVDGVYDDRNPEPDYYRIRKLPLLPLAFSLYLSWYEAYKPGFLTLNGQESEHAEMSFAAMAMDVNDDSYPDLWVANNLSFLRLYINEGGQRFRDAGERTPRHGKTGNWMSLAGADFNGDGLEDLMAFNLGGASMNTAVSRPRPTDLIDPVISVATFAQQQWVGDRHSSMHGLFRGSGFGPMAVKVRHSRVMPPDTSLPGNVRQYGPGLTQAPYDIDGLDPYEFAWGSTTLDVQNDGRPDVYWSGCMAGRGGGLFPILGSNPGRLLVNWTTSPARVDLVDLTAEYHLFNILELKYDKLETEGIVYRRSPSQNWGKRSVVRSTDLSVWGLQGPSLLERVANHDLIQTCENGRGVVAADLNDDGFADMILRNHGGYDSRSSRAVNLKGRRWDGVVGIIPAHDPNFPTPTNYEPGGVRVFLNRHAGRKGAGHWLKVDLVDDAEGALNRDALGARVTVVGDRGTRWTRVRRVGEGYLAGYLGPLLFGLGPEKAARIEVLWPGKDRYVSRDDLDGLTKGHVLVAKHGGPRIWGEAAEPE